jgi:pimeloyl-ACP methyl ester carboxylesterase
MLELAQLRKQGTDGWRNAGERLVGFRDELARRTALARQPQPVGVNPPALKLLLAELGSPVDLWRAGQEVRRNPPAVPRGRSRAVMMLPGFGAHPIRMRPLGRVLEAGGHRVSDWGMGWNLGPTEERFDRLCDRIAAMARKEREPVVLVGWSLGGIYAREAAKRLPEAVGMVVTMGTPFSGDRHANNAWRAYQAVTGHTVDEPPVGVDLAEKPPVPTVALWSPRDGIIAPRSACGRKGERDLAISVRCTHLGFASHPAVAATLAGLLARG